ncbi:unnamed protein product [Mucor hiemalis]
MVFPCVQCNSTGKVGSFTGCKVCNGRKKGKNIKIDVPPGVHNNHIIVLENMGNLLPDRYSRPDGRIRGDLRIKLLSTNQSEDNVFIRRGNNLHIKHALTLKEALMGFKLKQLCAHMDGRIIRITQGAGVVIQPQKVKVLKGEGMPVFASKTEEKGDLYVTFDIIFPEVLNVPEDPAQKEIIYNFLETPAERETREKTIVIEDNDSSDGEYSYEGSSDSLKEGDESNYEYDRKFRAARKRPFQAMEEDTEEDTEEDELEESIDKDEGTSRKYPSRSEKRQKPDEESPECINLVDDEEGDVTGSTPTKENSSTIPDLFEKLWSNIDNSTS